MDTILTIISLCHSPTSSSKKEKESKKKATSTTSSGGGGGGAAAGVVAMEVSNVEKKEGGGGEQGPSSSSSFSSRSSALASSVASQLIRMLAMELECLKPAVRAAIKVGRLVGAQSKRDSFMTRTYKTVDLHSFGHQMWRGSTSRIGCGERCLVQTIVGEEGSYTGR